MTSLSREDGGGDGEVRAGGNVLGGTGVSGDTDVLDQGSERDEGLDVCVGAENQYESRRHQDGQRTTCTRMAW